MPRSNKKKHPFKQPLKHPPSEELLNLSAAITSSLFSIEKTQMISRAIVSGQKHGIKLKHGSPNPGLGDCAFESIIQNNNDRQCFREHLLMPINYYRNI